MSMSYSLQIITLLPHLPAAIVYPQIQMARAPASQSLSGRGTEHH